MRPSQELQCEADIGCIYAKLAIWSREGWAMRCCGFSMCGVWYYIVYSVKKDVL